MLSIGYAKNYLKKNTDDLVYLLEILGFTKIQIRDSNIICISEEGCTDSISINAKNLFCVNNGDGIGDIFNLFNDVKGLNFLQALSAVYDILKLDNIKRKEVKAEDEFAYLYEIDDLFG